MEVNLCLAVGIYEVWGMKYTNVSVHNYTVFDDHDFDFCDGINVLLGKNGTGKTHLMKLMYSAGIAAKGRISFADKLVKTMLPLNGQISRLVSKGKGNSSTTLELTACENNNAPVKLSLAFNKKTKKWNGEMKGEEKWEASFRENNMTFIPAKEVLSNNYNLSAAVERGNVKFDDTYLDILSAAKVDVSKGRNEKEKSLMLRKIEKIIGGKVVYDAEQDQFFLKIGNAKQEFNLVSEGIRKLALLWTLVKNGALEDGSVFFWDEPEANINPSAIPLIAEILLMLQRHNVQIYIATHDYFLTKYLDVGRKKDDCIRYHSLYIDDKKIVCEQAERFTLLEHNPIMETFTALYKKEVEVSWNG